MEQQKVGRERGDHLLFKFKTIITSNHSKVSQGLSSERRQQEAEEEEEDDDRHQPGAWLWNVVTVKRSQSKHYHYHTEN